MERIEAEKMDLKKTSNRLLKHVDSLKKDMDKFHKEAKAVGFLIIIHQQKKSVNIKKVYLFWPLQCGMLSKF